MKYEKIKKVVSQILFENSLESESPVSSSFDSTIPKELPLDPAETASLNSIVSRPPVEDEDYVPKTPSELSAAVKALSEMMSSDDIALAYAKIKSSLVTRSEKSPVSESVYDDYEGLELPDDSDMPEEFRGAGYSIEEPDDIEEPKNFQASKSSGEASLQDILDSGILPDDVKSISGAKSFEGRAKRNLAYRSIFGAAAIEKAMRYALDIWVGALKADDRITDEQAKGFLQNARGSMDAPGFKAFFELGFMAPAMKPMRLARDKEVRKRMSALDVPPQLENMIFSQAVGLSPQNPSKIRLKLNRTFPDMKMSEMDEMTQKLSDFVKNGAKEFQQDFFKSIDLVEAVRTAWSKKSTDEKIDITYAAMDEVIDFEEKSEEAGLR